MRTHMKILAISACAITLIVGAVTLPGQFVDAADSVDCNDPNQAPYGCDPTGTPWSQCHVDPAACGSNQGE